MATLSVLKATAEQVAELLNSETTTANLIHAGQSFDLHVVHGLEGARRLIINSALGEDLIIDFN